jgi:NAD(P)-dependent dehydrogenase (short-subunit alcohol dehydrogenase family)
MANISTTDASRSKNGRLDGKVALITGGGAGIGRETALLFAREGAKVAIAEFSEEAGIDAAREIESAGGEAIFLATDVTLPESVQSAVRRTVARFGKLDILYNNVGGTNAQDGPVTDVPIEVFWSTMQRDLFGTFLGCRFAIPEIIKAGGGAVINAASLVAMMGKPLPSQVCYTAAKGGIVAMTRAMAVQYAGQKIRVNAIAPGVTLTPRLKKRLEAGKIPKGLMERHLLGLVEPTDIAYAVLYLASDESRFVTGHVLPVDSGIAMS